MLQVHKPFYVKLNSSANAKVNLQHNKEYLVIIANDKSEKWVVVGDNGEFVNVDIAYTHFTRFHVEHDIAEIMELFYSEKASKNFDPDEVKHGKGRARKNAGTSTQQSTAE